MRTSTKRFRLDEMRGAAVYDRDGDKIGSVEEIFYDDASRQPEWIGVGTGFFGTKRVLVPVQGASTHEDGIRVAYDKDQVKDSPDIDSDEIYGDRERQLYEYYGLDSHVAGGRASDGEFERRRADATESVTRSEEELVVGKQQTEAGRVRLRKWVETEPVALDVELQRETARVVREDIDEPVSNDERAFGNEEVEVRLRAEEPVAAKRTVAKERIGIEKDVQTQTDTIHDDVRRERVDVEGDVDRT